MGGVAGLPLTGPHRVAFVVKGADVLTQCAYCGAWQTTAGWMGGGPLVHTRHLAGELYRVSHGICPACSSRVIAEYQAFIAARGRD